MIKNLILNRGLFPLGGKNFNKSKLYSFNQSLEIDSNYRNTALKYTNYPILNESRITLISKENKRNFSDIIKPEIKKKKSKSKDIKISYNEKEDKTLNHNDTNLNENNKNNKSELRYLHNKPLEYKFNIFNYETHSYIFNSQDILYLNRKLKELNEKLDNVLDNPDNKFRNLIKMEKHFFNCFKNFQYSKRQASENIERKYHRFIFENNFSNFIILLYKENINNPMFTELAKIYNNNNSMVSNNSFNYKHKVDIYSDLIIKFFVENPHIDFEYKKILFNEKITNILKYTNIELFRIFKFTSEKILTNNKYYESLFYPFHPYDRLQKNVLLKKLNELIMNKANFIKNGYESLENFPLDYRQNIDLDIINNLKLDTDIKQYTFPHLLAKIKYIQMYRSLYQKNQIDLCFNHLNFNLKKFTYKQRISDILFKLNNYRKYYKYIEDEEFNHFLLTKLNRFLNYNFLQSKKDNFDNYIGINKNYGTYLKYRNFFNGLPHLLEYDIDNIKTSDNDKKSIKNPNEFNKDVLEKEFLKKFNNTYENTFKVIKTKSVKRSKLLKLTSNIEEKKNTYLGFTFNNDDKIENTSDFQNEIRIPVRTKSKDGINLNENENKKLIDKSQDKESNQKIKKSSNYHIFEGYQFVNFEINNMLELLFNSQPLLFLENIVESIRNRLISNSLEGNDLNMIFKIMAFPKLNQHVFKEIQDKISNYCKHNSHIKKQIDYIKSGKFDISIFSDCYDDYLKNMDNQFNYLLENPKFNNNLKDIYKNESKTYSHKNYYKKSNEINLRDSHSKYENINTRYLSEIINNLFYMRLVDMKNDNENEYLIRSIIDKIIMSIKYKKSIDLFDNEILENLLINDSQFEKKYQEEFLDNLNLSDSGYHNLENKDMFYYDISLISKNQEERNKLLLILLSFNNNYNTNESEEGSNILNYFYEKERGIFYDLLKFFDNKEIIFRHINHKYQRKFINKFERAIKNKKIEKSHLSYNFEIDYKLFNILNLGLKLSINDKKYIFKFVKRDIKDLDDYLFSDFYNQIILNYGFKLIEFDIKHLAVENKGEEYFDNQIKSIIDLL